MNNIKISDYMELRVKITPEMKADYTECGAMAKVEGGDAKDCDKCSLYCTGFKDLDLCEIPEVQKLLSEGDKIYMQSDESETNFLDHFIAFGFAFVLLLVITICFGN